MGWKGIKLDADALVLVPFSAEQQLLWLAWRMHHGCAPDQRAHFQLRISLDEFPEHFADGRGVRLCGAQADAAVEVPSQDEDRTAGLPQCAFKTGEVIFTVDEKRSALGPGDAPTGVARPQHPWTVE